MPLCGTTAPGELYVVQTRHCIHARMPVYKVGRAKDAGRRLQTYPKGSMMIARLPVSNMRDSERVLLSLCRLNLVPRRDFGSEYFEAHVTRVVALVVMVSMMFPTEKTNSPVTWPSGTTDTDDWTSEQPTVFI